MKNICSAMNFLEVKIVPFHGLFAFIHGKQLMKTFVSEIPGTGTLWTKILSARELQQTGNKELCQCRISISQGTYDCNGSRLQ